MNTLTESRNPASYTIDTVPTRELVQIINNEDATVAPSVASQSEAIANAIDTIAARMAQGGRLIYVGAGTSGRLGVLDASECPPTYGTPPELVVGLIAGGPLALTNSVEAAEDDPIAGAADVAALAASAQDSLVGIAASGRTPYVIGAMQEAKRRGALVISLACNHPSPMAENADIVIAPIVGPEIVTGSTRLKAGTAQKLVLNMLSTGVMIRLGKTYGNLMVDVQASNEKLRQRARRIVAEATGLSFEQAAAQLEACNDEVKTAIVAALLGVAPAEARQRLAAGQGVIRRALQPESTDRLL
jgi:N-acetylmuramic acid 6-phosphate etherase